MVLSKERTLRNPLWLTSVVVASVALTLQVGSAGPAISLTATLALIAVASIMIGRLLFEPVRERGRALEARSRHLCGIAGSIVAPKNADRFALARAFYYVGVITVTMTAFRIAGFTLSDWFFFLSFGALVLERTACDESGIPMSRGVLVG